MHKERNREASMCESPVVHVVSLCYQFSISVHSSSRVAEESVAFVFRSQLVEHYGVDRFFVRSRV
jgi:hypothetical protein